jgi:ribose transport system permease protein
MNQLPSTRDRQWPTGHIARRRLLWGQRELVLAFAILVAGAVFGLTNDTFLQLDNLRNIVVQSSMILTVGLGMFVVIVAGGIDLSVGAVAAVTGVVAVWLLEQGTTPPVLVLLVGILLGTFIGLANGLIITQLAVPGIITTLGSMTALRGVAFLIAGGFSVRSEDRTLAYLANGQLAGVPVPIVAVGAVFVVVHWLLAHTPLGRAFPAVGGNLQAARVAGIDVRATIVSAYAISATLAATAGLIAASRTASGSPLAGLGWELQAVAIVILGGASLFGGSGRALGTLLAGLLIGMTNNWISLQGASAAQNIVTGVLLITIVALSERQLGDSGTLLARLLKSGR